jgi:GTP-binding protein
MMLRWFQPTGRPVHVLLTKADKLTRSEGALTLQRVRAGLQALGVRATAQLFESPRRAGVQEAEAIIAGWLAGAGVGNKEAPSQRGKLGAKGLNGN